MSSDILGDSFFPASNLLDLDFIELSMPELNKVLSGGLPRGRAIEIFAEKSEGKTSLALYFVKEAQAQGFKCAWADAEGTLHKPYAEAIGVKLEELSMIEFTSGEDLLYKIKLALASNLFDIIVLDSINAVTPAELSESKIEGLKLNQKMEAPKMWAKFFKDLDGGYQISSPATKKSVQSNVVHSIIDPKTLTEEKVLDWHKLVDKKTCFIAINHRMTRIGVTFGSKEYTPGGTRKDFTFSLRLNLKKRKTKMGKSGGEKILKFKIIELRTDKNKIGIPLQSLLLQFNPDGTIIPFDRANLKDEEDET